MEGLLLVLFQKWDSPGLVKPTRRVVISLSICMHPNERERNHAVCMLPSPFAAPQQTLYLQSAASVICNASWFTASSSFWVRGVQHKPHIKFIQNIHEIHKEKKLMMGRQNIGWKSQNLWNLAGSLHLVWHENASCIPGGSFAEPSPGPFIQGHLANVFD